MWEKTCLVCDPLSTNVTFTTEACQKTLQIKKGPLNCHSKKVLCLLKCKVCGEVPCIRKQKTNFASFSNRKSKHRTFRRGNQKVPQKCFHTHYCHGGHNGTDDWDFVIFEHCETHEQLIEREDFCNTDLKPFI